ncbi:dual OB domain-containing protein [Thiorhodococcus minor]|uniref:Dual OB-containing domain-containing protein n=1 Tax=Thiorhodococcus minor TaxID=57489 RepID=A0A6M0K2J2_9GAMM|nr:hypothetical protein [Thiorhodococcus minor]NEV63524.1 hypothetical protein [Thiorhodococcus minor]
MAAYTKTLVVLANSCKHNARCLAGKELTLHGLGDWVRPVSALPTGELLPLERRLVGGGEPALLDVVEVPLQGPSPAGFQTENHRVAPAGGWVKRGWLDPQWLHAAVDDCPTLWVNGYSSSAGCNDRLPEPLLAELQTSLALIGPIEVELRVLGEKVRARFVYQAVTYDLCVTDPRIKATYAARAEGCYGLGAAFVCLSLAPAWHGYAYKLAAAIMTPNAG